MHPRSARELEILTAIGENQTLTQRALAARLGVALGLTNLYLRRLARKGYIKVTQFPRKPLVGKRLRYLLTAKGLAEKTQLTATFFNESLVLYRRTRRVLHAALTPVVGAGHQRIALYGTGEAAELAYLTLREMGVEPVCVVDDAPANGHFLGLRVRTPGEVAWAEVDLVVAAVAAPAEVARRLDAQGVPAAKIVPVAGGGGRRVGQRFSS